MGNGYNSGNIVLLKRFIDSLISFDELNAKWDHQADNLGWALYNARASIGE